VAPYRPGSANTARYVTASEKVNALKDLYGEGVNSGYEPGEPTDRDLEVLALLQSRDGALTDVELDDGRRCRVWNIVWGYDAGDCWAHITTNVGPNVSGERTDFFLAAKVDVIRAPDSGEVLLGPVSRSS